MNKANQHWLTSTPSGHNVGRVSSPACYTWPSPSISGIVEMEGMTSIKNFVTLKFPVFRVHTYISIYLSIYLWLVCYEL